MILHATPAIVKPAVLFSALRRHPAPAGFGRGVIEAPAVARPATRWATEDEARARHLETTYSKAERDFAVRHSMTMPEAREELALMDQAADRELEHEAELAAMHAADSWEEADLAEARTTVAEVRRSARPRTLHQASRARRLAGAR